MVGGEVTPAPHLVQLTPSQRKVARRGFKLNEDLCRLVNDTPPLGEYAKYSVGEEKELEGENGILCKYFPFQYYTEKTEKKSSAMNPRVKEVEFIRMYGCSNARQTGCKCYLYTARVPGAILAYEKVDEEGIPFQHVHNGLNMMDQSSSADDTAVNFSKTDETSMMNLTNSDEACLPVNPEDAAVSQLCSEFALWSSPKRVTHPSTNAGLKKPNPSGTPTGTSRRSKNAKRDKLSSAGGAMDASLFRSDEGKLGSSEDDILQALFKRDVAAVPPDTSTFVEGRRFDSPNELFVETLGLFMSGGMKKSNLGKENKGSMTLKELEETPWGNCVFIDPRDGLKSEVPSRGRLFCKHAECRWCVPFSYFKRCRSYEIRSGGENNKMYHNHLCLEHNHSPDIEDTGFEGYIEIKNRNDLTVAEKDLLRACAQLNAKMPTIQHALSNAFGVDNKRTYNSELLRREVERFKEEMFGTDEHRMKELMEMGQQVQSQGGHFGFDVSGAMVMTGIRFQTPLMRKYAEQYGGYFVMTDGTFGMNKYGLTVMPWTGCDCCGITHCFGISSGLSENSVDAIKAARAFHLSSIVETGAEETGAEDDETAELETNEEIDGITIENHVLKNSYKGSLYTDDGPFSRPLSKAIGKNPGLCTYHEMAPLSTATTGQPNADDCRRDLSALIFRHRSIEELNEKISECRSKYGTKPEAMKFIDALEDKKEKVCLAYTQWKFSFNHSSTQRAEGYNDRLKGHADLKAMLSQADLVTMHKHVKAIEVDVSTKVIKMLEKHRRNWERVATIYEDAVDESIRMCTLHVKSCSKIGNTGSKYEVQCSKGPAVVVDLDTKIVHRGQVFIIPTCTCGYWCSSFRICMHIVKALLEDVREVKSVKNVKNIHPIHLLQLHPLWPEALRKCKMEDYNDLPQIGMILGVSQVKTEASAPAAAAVCPDEF
ncbi:hypothetical protein QTG54_012404 [Skeletonema marinoi]|uniref:SWIM-type domain-containing protein n=1 Tax=Skeletonema marinoi TaxID=267567 RepID=A0AAD8XZU3_9STRA|nr:hypothetical protein QTG54_012404 [Skeletonema marinoi]